MESDSSNHMLPSFSSLVNSLLPNFPVTSNLNNEIYNVPSEILNQNIESVLIYKDPKLCTRFEDTHIIKGAVYHFILLNVFSKNQINENLTVDIKKDIFTPDKRRTIQEPNKISGVISAKVTDTFGNELDPCKTCSNSKMVSLRYVKKEDLNLIVVGSVNCSGNPSNSNRKLQISFNIKGSLVSDWNGASRRFCVYHHKPPKKNKEKDNTLINFKLNSNSNNNSNNVVNQNLLKQHGLMKRTLKSLPDEEPFKQVTAELYSHLIEMCDADSSIGFSKASIHNTFIVVHYFIEHYKALTKSNEVYKYHKNILEYFLTGYSVFEMIYGPQTESKIKSGNFFRNKMLDMSKDSIDPVVYNAIYQYYFNATLQIPHCNCSECFYSYLAFVIQHAYSKGVSTTTIAQQLNYLNIPTKQNKVWHPSLNGFLNRESRFLAITPSYDFNNNFHKFCMAYMKEYDIALIDLYKQLIAVVYPNCTDSDYWKDFFGEFKRRITENKFLEELNSATAAMLLSE